MKLVNATELDNNLTELANLLRERTGETSKLDFPDDFLEQVEKTTTLDEFASAGSLSGPIYLNSATQIAAYTFANMPITEIHAPNVTRFYTNLTSSITGKGIFYNCNQLTIVDLPNLTSVGAGGYQFANCTALTNIHLPKSNQGWYMFLNCTNLKTAILNGNGSTNTYGFSGCTSLLAVEYTGNLTKIGNYEFNGATKMNTLVIRNTTMPTLANINAFTNTPFASGKTGGILYVPNNLIETYTNATNWSTIIGYTNNQILPIENSIYATEHIDETTIGG